MTVEKKKIINKEKCDGLMNDIYNDRRFYAYLHKVMINTYDEYSGLNRIIELDDFKGECFLKIYKSLDLYDSEKGTMKTFCIRCIKSTALQELRKSRAVKNQLKNKDNVVSLESALDDDGDCDLNDIVPGKDDEYFTEDFQQEVLKAIDKLSPREKETMLMKIEGYKTSEIAEILNTTSNNVTNRLAKARNKLRKDLNQ
jgi:RNA polymerase sigma factor (sigma-70 family)